MTRRCGSYHVTPAKSIPGPCEVPHRSSSFITSCTVYSVYLRVGRFHNGCYRRVIIIISSIGACSAWRCWHLRREIAEQVDG
jgi:hypothetical protein